MVNKTVIDCGARLITTVPLTATEVTAMAALAQNAPARAVLPTTTELSTALGAIQNAASVSDLATALIGYLQLKGLA